MTWPPSAAGTVKVPPLITVPTGAVVMVADVADGATHGVEGGGAGHRRGGRGQDQVAGRGLGGAHEVGEDLHVGAVVLGIGHQVFDHHAVHRVVDGEQRGGDAHLVQVGIGRERHQAGVLVLPTEAPDPSWSRAAPPAPAPR